MECDKYTLLNGMVNFMDDAIQNRRKELGLHLKSRLIVMQTLRPMPIVRAMRRYNIELILSGGRHNEVVLCRAGSFNISKDSRLYDKWIKELSVEILRIYRSPMFELLVRENYDKIKQSTNPACQS